MNLLDLAHELGLQPKRASSTNGGEYKGPCPSSNCGGKDRFIIWPVADRYWCRQCNKGGDSIQFCRDFMGMGYQAACAKLGMKKKIASYSNAPRETYSRFVPKVVEIPSKQWKDVAHDFVSRCHEALLRNPEAICSLTKRGLSMGSIKEHSLGWWGPDFEGQFLSLTAWGLPAACNEKGREKKLWVPSGIAIPTFAKEEVMKLKIRRRDWKEGDTLPKYIEISGSMKCPGMYGDVETRAILIIESELDGMLIHQLAGDLCNPVALGGVGKKPDFDTDCLLRRARQLLFALDFDEAGKNAYKFWKSTYPNIKPWPVPKGKSPGDAHEQGVNIRQWIELGIKEFF